MQVSRHDRRYHDSRIAIGLVVLLLLCFVPSARTDVQPVKKILIINEAGSSYPAIDIVNRAIQTTLAKSPYKLEFYSEYLDTILFPDTATQREFRKFILHKYQNRKPDVIITVGPSAVQFMRETHKRAFAGIPLVFCLPTGTMPSHPIIDDDFTGVESDLAPGKTVQAALQLLPGTERVIVVGGESAYDQQMQEAVRQELKFFEGRIPIEYLTSLAMPDLLDRLRHLPAHTVILFTTIGQDAAGNKFKSSESAPLIVGAANAPVFSLFDTYINHGEVGGSVSSLGGQGEIAGGMVLRLLHGERVKEIPRVKDATSYVFDSRALRRWALEESNLPTGSLVLNRKPTFWEPYERYVIPGILVLLVQSAGIIGLLWQRARRRKTERQLLEANERLLVAIEKVRESRGQLEGIITSTMDAIIAVDTQHRIVVFNPAAEKMFECSAQNALGTAINRFIPERYRLAHAGHINDFAASGRTNSAVDGRTDLWALRANGQEFPIETSISQMEADGKKLFAVVLRDITQRKMAEEALSSVSRRLIEAHEEERTWIARELHDDVSQRLALLAGTLDILKSELPPGANEAKHYLADVKEQTKELAADVQALSHRLHSSKLEYLGLASAAAAFCREFSESKGVQIDFQSDDVPRSLPKEISLCLFRVMQEALQNASKHSGSEHYNVILVRTSEEIRLTVSDFGRGFDPEVALRSAGLGITSMRERLKLVAGEFTIESRSQFGTTVQARVPLAPKAKEARAGASPDDGYKEAMVPTGD